MSGGNIMNDKIFKSLQYSNCYMNTAQFNIFDVTIPCNSVIYIDVCENTMYICSRFPNYSGDAKNVILNVTWYDYEMHTIGTTTIKNCDASIALYILIFAKIPCIFVHVSRTIPGMRRMLF